MMLAPLGLMAQRKATAKTNVQAGALVNKLLAEFGVPQKLDFTKDYKPVESKEVFLITGNPVFTKYKVYYKDGLIESVAVMAKSPKEFRDNKEYIISAVRRVLGKEVDVKLDSFSEEYRFNKDKDKAEIHFSSSFNEDPFNNINLSVLK